MHWYKIDNISLSANCTCYKLFKIKELNNDIMKKIISYLGCISYKNRYKNCIKHIPTQYSIWNFELIQNMYNMYIYTDFELLISRMVSNKSVMKYILLNCICCKRHNVNKTVINQEYNQIRRFNRNPCSCNCRNLYRHILKSERIKGGTRKIDYIKVESYFQKKRSL